MLKEADSTAFSLVNAADHLNLRLQLAVGHLHKHIDFPFRELVNPGTVEFIYEELDVELKTEEIK